MILLQQTSHFKSSGGAGNGSRYRLTSNNSGSA
jgi:hypothetical protein